MKTLTVTQIDHDTWELYIDGTQQGQYPSARAGKSAARRRCYLLTRPLKWHETSDEGRASWVARVSE